MKADFQIKINEKYISHDTHKLIQSIVVTDEVGMSSDALSLVFNDDEGRLAIPRRGVKISISMGEHSELFHLGTYIVDEVSIEPSRMIITAKGFDASSALKTMKTRSFNQEVYLEDVLKVIAIDHELIPNIAKTIGRIQLSRNLAQQNESDLHFLTRLAKIYNAVFKIQGANLLFMPKDTGKSVSGLDLGYSIVNLSDLDKWQAHFSGRSEYKKVIAQVFDVDTGIKHQIIAGDPTGFPILTLPGQYRNKTEALQDATSYLEKSGYESSKLSLTLTANYRLRAESHIELHGAKSGIDGFWIVEKSVLTLDANDFKLDLDCVKSILNRKDFV